MTFYQKNIIFLNDAESTNNYANQLIMSKQAVEGTVVLAYYQRNGKGQGENSWESEAGKNIILSVILFPEFLPAEKQFLLSKIVSLALLDFIQTKVKNASIKWPNDIYVGNQKIAGILIENSVQGKNMFSSVIGIGFNLNQEKFISNAPNPVSLKQITGKDYDVKKVAIDIAGRIFKGYERLKRGEIDAVNSRYYENLYRKNQWLKFRKKGLEFEARISGIGEFGQLQLEEKDGTISKYLFKEIEFVL